MTLEEMSAQRDALSRRVSAARRHDDTENGTPGHGAGNVRCR
jgi:hypothetical protein